MQNTLAVETLASGDSLTIECVSAPGTIRDTQIRPFLGHKPDNYLAHIDAALAGECDELETRYYIGLIDNAIVGNIMTIEYQGIGIFGHVFTRPDQRRKGICDRIMRYQMEDFRQRNGKVLLLGTGYQSAAYHIYEKHGFVDWPVGSPGLMRYDTATTETFITPYFAPSATKTAPMQWKHWPGIALLATIPTTFPLRSLTFDLWTVGLLEGPFCQFQHHYGGKSQVYAGVLESVSGAVVGVATCTPSPQWHGSLLLDIFSHPNITGSELTNLLVSLDLPKTPIQCYADPHDSAKITALEETGFHLIASIPQQYHANDTWHSVLLYARNSS